MSAIRSVRTVGGGLVPVAALVTAFTALAAVTMHAQHVSAGYTLDRAVRETQRRQREIRRLETRRAALMTPAAIRAAAERLGVPLDPSSGDRPTSIDLDRHVRERVRPVEDVIWSRNVR